MRLTDLHPRLTESSIEGARALMFDCPFPGCHHHVRVLISPDPYHEHIPEPGQEGHDGRGKPHPDYDGPPLPPLRPLKIWQASGDFPDTLTLVPSIDVVETNEKGEKIRTLCWHGHITNGEVT